MEIRTIITTVAAKPQPSFRFRNYYECANDGTKWHDEWISNCNDRCPVCDSEIEPYLGEDLEPMPE